MASGIQRLDEDGLPRVVAQNRSDRGDVALQHLWLNVRLRPERVEELLVSHESPGVLDEIAHTAKALRARRMRSSAR